MSGYGLSGNKALKGEKGEEKECTDPRFVKSDRARI